MQEIKYYKSTVLYVGNKLRKYNRYLFPIWAMLYVISNYLIEVIFDLSLRQEKYSRQY